MQAVTRYSIESSYIYGVPYPSDATWDKIFDDVCLPQATKFMSHDIDPEGRFAVSGLRPTEHSWIAGDRHIECGIFDQRPVAADLYSGPSTSHFGLFEGDARGARQSFDIPIGECHTNMAWSGRTITAVVPCSQPHWVEYVGAFELPASEARPTDETFAARIRPRCTALATSYAGHPIAESRTFFVSASPISEASWNDGNRTVNCGIFHTTATGDPAPVTGSEKTATGKAGQQ